MPGSAASQLCGADGLEIVSASTSILSNGAVFPRVNVVEDSVAAGGLSILNEGVAFGTHTACALT